MLRRLLPIVSVLALSVVSVDAHGDERICGDRDIAAPNVRTLTDIQAFVECAHAIVAERGTAEAYDMFHGDPRWRHGEIYLFVFELNPNAEEALTFMNTRAPETEGIPVGNLFDDYGGEIIRAGARVVQANGSGWFYYQFVNPETGRVERKTSFAMGIDWNGTPAWIGAGEYFSDIPGSCGEHDVNAAMVESAPSEESLRQFVRCAAYLVELEGYLAVSEFRDSQRWNSGSIYVFGLDLMGGQVFSGNRFRVNGAPLHEWGTGAPYPDQFHGRDMAGMADTFGEAFVYYRSYSPATGTHEKKVGFLKRTVAHGVPLLIGAGYFAE